MENTSIPSYTIGRLARAAGVGVETIRYYQRRQLLPIPHSDSSGGFRAYPAALVDRIRFIKRAQELGFNLEEVGHLLSLEDGDDKVAIRDVANERLLQVRAKLADLQKIELMLSHLIHQCEASVDSASCPIIQALAQPQPDN